MPRFSRGFEARVNYLLILAVGFPIERLLNYLIGSNPIILGQPINVVFTAFYVTLALIAATRVRNATTANGILRVFLVALACAWIAHLILYRIHGDAFNYTALVYLPILLVLGLRVPSPKQVATAVLAFAWSMAAVLLLAGLLEFSGLRQPKTQLSAIVQFDEERYFLPLNDLLGIDGRWPGPFGHNGDTAMVGALLIVIGVGFWSRSSWFLLGVGAVTLTLTNGRASIGAAAAGLVIVGMFSRSQRLTLLPQWLRIGTGIGVLSLGAVVMVLRPAGLTGRENIWPAFLELWWESPWIGVGGSGFADGNAITQQFGHAHSLYIEELARSGLIGFIAQFAALGIGVFIAARAAGIGYPGPLAVMVAYFVTGVTEPRNNWIEPSATWFLLILMVLAASARLVSEERNRSTDREDDSLPSSPPA